MTWYIILTQCSSKQLDICVYGLLRTIHPPVDYVTVLVFGSRNSGTCTDSVGLVERSQNVVVLIIKDDAKKMQLVQKLYFALVLQDSF